MNKEIAQLLLLSSNDNSMAEKAIIYAYIIGKRIKYTDNKVLRDYLSDIKSQEYGTVNEYLNQGNLKINKISELLCIMEQLVSDNDKKVNGVVYTPNQIKQYMIGEMDICSNYSTKTTICDPACGCGSFLVSLADFLHRKFNVSFSDLFQKCLFGVDILEHNVLKSKVLLTILALEHGENYERSFNLRVANSLSTNWTLEFPNVFKYGGFDFIIGNPPYVSLKNMTEDVRQSLASWKTSNYGNTDLYIVFYELALNIAKSTGTIGFITINSFFSSLNARGLRQLIKNTKVDFCIHNFADKQLFENIQSYTCISIIKKGLLQETLITKYNSEFNNGVIKTDRRKKIRLKLDKKIGTEPWLLINKTELTDVSKMQSFKHKLSDYQIKNGIATLRNDIYIFTPSQENDEYYFFFKDNVQWVVEKQICRDIIKPNIIKNEQDLTTKLEKAIFPYYTNNNIILCYDEHTLSDEFPQAYLYLSSQRDELAKRDKGTKKYEQWYAFGRRQGMNPNGIKVLIPYIAEHPIAVITTDNEMLYYCGNAIFVESLDDAKFVKRVIESSLFDYYIRSTSKPYSNGFYSLSKSYIKNFTIPEFTDSEYKYFITLNQNDANTFLENKYDINLRCNYE
ncbi:MAG: N-6 DNA methylase [Oscillospiraceae bacterium]|nr:N-6 DNA methylase [Oscillospiraceae bacterium]